MTVASVSERLDDWVVGEEKAVPSPFLREGAGAGRRLAIVGKGRLTREYAPFAQPHQTPPPAPPQMQRPHLGRGVLEGWEVWTYNEYAFENGLVPTGMFEVHADALTCDRYTSGYQAWLREAHPFPIYTLEQRDDIPSSAAIPWQEISDRYFRNVWHGKKQVRDFFTSTTPYALGLAAFMGYREVHLFGIELNATQGYRDERDCVFFWMGVLNALGVELHMHPLSRLFYDAVYGL